MTGKGLHRSNPEDHLVGARLDAGEGDLATDLLAGGDLPGGRTEIAQGAEFLRK